MIALAACGLLATVFLLLGAALYRLGYSDGEHSVIVHLPYEPPAGGDQE